MRKLLLSLVLLLGAAAVQADNGLFYVGAGVGTSTNSEYSGTPWKVLVGLRPISVFAVEADYVDLGTQTSQSCDIMEGCFTSSSHDKAFGAYAVGFAPIPVSYLDVFGKLGVQRWTSSDNGFSVHSTEFAWGVGAQVHFGNIAARLEYDGFHADVAAIPAYANVISLSVILSL